MLPVIEHDAAGGRFTATMDGRQAVLVYLRVDDRTVDFASTFVPDALRGHQVGTLLVRHALAWAREQGLHVVPSCWFVRVIGERSPDYRDLLSA
jgi:predicted GNAT family acetyltransferase